MTTERVPPMIRLAIISMIAAGLALGTATVQAQTAEAPRHTRKAGKVKKAPAPVAAPAAHSINTPSTDFSKIERADGDESGPNGPTFRPTMGAGGMGVGGAF